MMSCVRTMEAAGEGAMVQLSNEFGVHANRWNKQGKNGEKPQ